MKTDKEDRRGRGAADGDPRRFQAGASRPVFSSSLSLCFSSAHSAASEFLLLFDQYHQSLREPRDPPPPPVSPRGR